MRVQTKVIILLLLLGVIFTASLLIHNRIGRRTLSLMLQQDEREKNDIFHKLLALKAKGMELFAFDYTYWDEMVNFVNDPQNKKDWAAQNIETGLGTFNTDSAWIFNINGDLAYSVSNLDDETLKNFPFSAEAIKKIFIDKRLCHFFINTGQGVEEIRGATIHPTLDPERKTDPKGYFFAAKLWDKDYIDELSQLTGGIVAVTFFSPGMSIADDDNVDKGTIHIFRLLNGPDGLPVARISVFLKSASVLLLNRQIGQYSLLFAIFAFLVFILIIIFITRWISVPLSLISKTLKTQDVVYINKLNKGKGEFGSISRLIEKFFEQRESFVKEIDERKRAEAALRESDERFRQVAESAGEWIWEVDSKGLYTYSSPAVKEILGYQPEEIVGKKYFYDFFHPDVKEELKRGVFESFAKKENFRSHINLNVHKNGSMVILDTNATPVIDEHGVLKGYRGADKDITKTRHAEEELRAAYSQLTQTQAQLVQSAKMASLGQLASGIAHEVNNPLTGVLNNIQLIRMMEEQKKELDMAEVDDVLKAAEESALRCKKITQSLLEFSRASKGVMQLVSLNEVIEKVIDIVGYEIKMQNININKDLTPDLPLVMGSFQLLQQVIFDMIANAKWAIEKKAGKAGGVIIIRTGLAISEKQVYVSISDNGIGIAAHDMDKIFEPFFTTKPMGEGTGLGLSIAYGIIKEHHGNIKVESEQGKGATFRINLPLSSLAGHKEEENG
ncbi:MAG: ATP-binding protein [Candidatus Omnitrophota bacterium]